MKRPIKRSLLCKICASSLKLSRPFCLFQTLWHKTSFIWKILIRSTKTSFSNYSSSQSTNTSDQFPNHWLCLQCKCSLHPYWISPIVFTSYKTFSNLQPKQIFWTWGWPCLMKKRSCWRKVRISKRSIRTPQKLSYCLARFSNTVISAYNPSPAKLLTTFSHQLVFYSPHSTSSHT